jgi:hypothetical protein
MLAAFAQLLSVIKGPTDISDVGPDTARAVGIVLLLAVVSAVFAGSLALAAAYGRPELVSRARFFEEGGIEGYRFNQAKIADRLRDARACTLIPWRFSYLRSRSSGMRPARRASFSASAEKISRTFAGK